MFEPPEPSTVTAGEILGTDWVGWPWGEILEVSLDSPAAGPLTDPLSLRIDGWIVGASKAARNVTALIHPYPPDGLPLLNMPVSFVRQDVLARFADLRANAPTGFGTILSTAGLPRRFEISLEARFDDGSVERFARVRGTHEPIDTGFKPALHPLMVTSLGRTGTTWLMRLLAKHPQIAVYDAYPYEARASTYWLHAFDVLAEPSDSGLADKDGFHLDRTAVRNNPLYESCWGDSLALGWLRGEYVIQAAQFAQKATEGFYKMVAARNGCSDPCCFAEKFHVGRGRWIARSLYPGASEIVLVRDPRDVFCSILAFNHKRNTVGFGRQEVTSDQEFVGTVGLDFTRLLSVLDEDPDGIHLVRYEDLVTEPIRTLEGVVENAGLDASTAIIRRMLEEAARDAPELVLHRTSADVRSSIGRWRTDLPPELQNHCNVSFAAIVERLGYEPA